MGDCCDSNKTNDNILPIGKKHLKNVLKVVSNLAKKFADQAKGFRDEAKSYRDSARYYAEQNTNVTVEYVNAITSELDRKILNNKNSIETDLEAFESDTSDRFTDVNTTLETLSNKDLSNISAEGKSLIRETAGLGISLFDIVPKDHILSYAETKGFAQLGSYVYKEALAGSYYGYPDFYSKIIEEFQDANNTTETVSGITVTVNSNGHRFYNIADKAAIDTIYNNTGEAWYYGIDTTNERIFLPRSTRIKFGSSNEAGTYQAAGLPNITGHTTGGNLGNSSSLTGVGALWQVSSGVSNSGVNSGTNQKGTYVYLDASRSSSVYGGSSTVEYSSTKLIPYMVVGNVFDWTGMTEVVRQGVEILQQVSNHIDTNVSNISDAGKSLISSWGMPDYANAISPGFPTQPTSTNPGVYTAPCNGLIWVYGYKSTAGNTLRLTVNNVQIGVVSSEVANATSCLYALVSKGDVIMLATDSTSAAHTINRQMFIPMKGAN